MSEIPAADLRALLHDLHSTAAQDAATARIALTIWRQARDRGNDALAKTAAADIEAALESLFIALARIEARGKEILRDRA
ncbi:MAG: hypothetical protein FJ033_00660 [Chloroflexi bacterium]|nr:hypothetical protein [Chloroflexota bacterium]